MDRFDNTYDLYADIKERTGGEIYLGILGPVRTGKSTFIKRFMEEMVLPHMEDANAKMRAMDEMPQSAGGKTITTTEPKFVPNEAAKITLSDDIAVSVRLVDCVGYLVEGAVGHMEEGEERMVKTPWFEEEIPFSKAAQIGTDKVMKNHSTIGIVVTTDGTIGELPRMNYLEAEEKTIVALKKTHKPFVVLLNSSRPYAEETRQIAKTITDKYGVTVMPINCEQLKKEDIHKILEQILCEFPITAITFYMPKWVESLPKENPIKSELVDKIKTILPQYTSVGDVLNKPIVIESKYIRQCRTDSVDFSNGCIKICFEMEESYYYERLSELLGENIADEAQLLKILQSFAEMKQEYVKVMDAVTSVRMKGYGVVTPDIGEITLEKPELIRQGNKFGVKMLANSPSIHMIKANIETEIAPIVGTQQQAEDLIAYIGKSEEQQGIWSTNIFGKTVEQLVNDGITTKISSLGEESQVKLQDTMQKIVNDNSGGMVCIII